MAIYSTPTVTEYDNNEVEHRRRLALGVNKALSGKLNVVTTVTLTAAATTTTLTDARLTPQSVISFMPTTANAAAGITALYVTNLTNGSATLNHANNAQADRIYQISIIG